MKMIVTIRRNNLNKKLLLDYLMKNHLTILFQEMSHKNFKLNQDLLIFKHLQRVLSLYLNWKNNNQLIQYFKTN